MICWTSSSTRRAVALALALALASLAGCRHGPRSAPAPLLLAVFPVQNAAGGAAPIRALSDALERAIASLEIATVPRPELEALLARHRLRFTGGVDRAMARVLRDELNVDAVLIPTLELHGAEAPPRVAMAVRLVKVSERPVVLWADVVERSGADSPGLLGIGLVTRIEELERQVIEKVARSVADYVANRSGGQSCGEPGRFEPRRAFRAPVLDDVGRRSVAVLPFANDTTRRGAGEVLVGQFVAELARSGAFEVLDPGVVREELLAHRLVLEGGVSVDRAMTILELLQADLVLSGDVQVHVAPPGGLPPHIEFTSYVIDGETAELVWSSSSSGDGNEGVFFFGAGRVYTSSALSCRMVRGVVDQLVGERGKLGPADPVSTPQALRWRRRTAQFQRKLGRQAPRNTSETATGSGHGP
jgi:TolB-like protein